MKQLKLFFGLLLLVIILTGISFAEEFKAPQPFLITPSGQNPDALMIKILSQKNNLNFAFEKLAQPDTLKEFKTLILVCGGSTKGLGAANIDKEQEIERVEKLVKAAKAQKMKIIAMHIGGKARRGKLSDIFNIVAAESADCLIVKSDGNEDNFFTKIAEQKKIPLISIEKIMDAGDVLKKIFADEK